MYVDAQGVEHISYDNPIIESSAGREKALAQHQLQEKDYVTTDDRGHSVHISNQYTIDEQGAIHDSKKNKTIQTQESARFLNKASDSPTPFTRNEFNDVINQVGDSTEMNKLNAWSKKNSSPEFRELFRHAVNTGNADDFKTLYQDLREHYNEANQS